MNILIVNKYYFVSGGPERYLFTLEKKLNKDGHRVIPLALKVSANVESEYSDDFVDSPFGDGAAK